MTLDDDPCLSTQFRTYPFCLFRHCLVEELHLCFKPTEFCLDRFFPVGIDIFPAFVIKKRAIFHLSTLRRSY